MRIHDLIKQGKVRGKLILPPGLYEIDSLWELGAVALEGCLDFAEGAALPALEDEVHELSSVNAINKDDVTTST